jgi:hypothetical protein
MSSGKNPDKSPFTPELVKGRVALITGGGSGIGFEIARQVRVSFGNSRSIVGSALGCSWDCMAPRSWCSEDAKTFYRRRSMC